MDVLLLAPLVDPLTASFGAIRGIKNGDETSFLFEPFDHIGDGGIRCSTTKPFTFLVLCVEELRGWLGRVIAAVFSNVEDRRLDRNP